MTCTRRTVLQTIGAGAVGCVMAACSGEGTEGNVPAGRATLCDGNLCVSLAENPDLTAIGGIALFSQVPGEKIFVMRVSETELRALSAKCTHQACIIEWDGAQGFDCPCHGSRFDAAGAATRGPAIRRLDAFATVLEGDLLTVTLPA